MSSISWYIKLILIDVCINFNFITNLSLVFIAYNLLFPILFYHYCFMLFDFYVSIHCNLMSIISMQLFFIFIVFKFHVFIQCIVLILCNFLLSISLCVLFLNFNVTIFLVSLCMVSILGM